MAKLPSFISKGHCCPPVSAKGIAAIIYLHRALLSSHISRGHCCHYIFSQGIGNDCCHHTYPKGTAPIIYPQRAPLPSYIPKEHHCHNLFPKGITAIIYFQRMLPPSKGAAVNIYIIPGVMVSYNNNIESYHSLPMSPTLCIFRCSRTPRPWWCGR